MEHHELILTCGIWAETTGQETAWLLDVTPELRRASKIFDPTAQMPRMRMTPTEARALRNLLAPEETLLHLLAA